MGIFRLILAISVVSAHFENHFSLNLIGGLLAVQSFYLISGFYMAMIIRSYQIKKFMLSRFLRIYPSYFVVLSMSAIFLLWQNNLEFNKYMLLPNLTLIGLDASHFVKWEGGQMELVRNFQVDVAPLISYIVVPQAWTLSLEILFYIYIAFFNKQKKLLLLTLTGSLVVRFLLYVNNYNIDPWSYRFFPNEIAIFLVGYYIYTFRQVFRSKLVNNVLLSLLMICTLSLYNFVSVIHFDSKYDVFINIFYLALVATSLPYLHLLGNKIRFDNFLGKISYGVYISHIFVISLVSEFYLTSNIVLNSIMIYAFSITLGIGLYYLVDRNVNKLRVGLKN
jgi:peptidoglycan/LPS O-acetylase OafA/YrhL